MLLFGWFVCPNSFQEALDTLKTKGTSVFDNNFKLDISSHHPAKDIVSNRGSSDQTVQEFILIQKNEVMKEA